MLGDVWVPEGGGTLAGQKKECEAFSLNPLFQGLLLGDLHMKWYLIHWHFVGSRKSAMARALVKGGLSQKPFNWSTIRLQSCRTSNPLKKKGRPRSVLPGKGCSASKNKEQKYDESFILYESPEGMSKYTYKYKK